MNGAWGCAPEGLALLPCRNLSNAVERCYSRLSGDRIGLSLADMENRGGFCAKRAVRFDDGLLRADRGKDFDSVLTTFDVASECAPVAKGLVEFIRHGGFL
jgi:hypothetical protein